MAHESAFGRFWPEPSILHDLDARVKLVLALALVVVVFCAKTYYGLLFMTAATITCYALGRIPLHIALKAILPLMPIVLLTFILNLLFIHGGTVLLDGGFFQISQAGLHQACFIGWRLTLLISTMCLLTLTTSTLTIADATESLLKPFQKVGVPAHELSMMMGIALRFLPLFAEEFHHMYNAQVSRGALLDSAPKKLGGKARLAASLIVPLFASAFRHADTLSQAMDSRCYHGATGRTKLHPMKVHTRDFIAIGITAALLAAVILINVFL